MSFFVWDQKYSVQIKEIDTQHQKLVAMVNELFEGMKAGKGNEALEKVLHELVGYTKMHFATEERLMKTHGYPDMTAHLAEHENLTRQVLDLVEQLKSGKTALTIKVSNFLKDWLMNHIMNTDKKYVPFLTGKGVR